MSTELEELRKRKTQLENELRSFDEQEKAIGTSLRMLEEKMAVHELEEKVKAKRAAVEQLESRKRNLEDQLRKPHS